MPSASGSTSLFSHGIVPKPEVVCPPLDPTAPIQISDQLIKIYQENIDALISQLGKNVFLNFDPNKEECPNCEFDQERQRSNGRPKPGGPRPFSPPRQCPYCKAKGFVETPNQECIKCLIKWNPQDLERYGISVEDEVDVVRLKTFLTDYDSIVRANTIISDKDIAGDFRFTARKIRGPVPVGLRDDRYCISFWEVIDI